MTTVPRQLHQRLGWGRLTFTSFHFNKLRIPMRILGILVVVLLQLSNCAIARAQEQLTIGFFYACEVGPGDSESPSGTIYVLFHEITSSGMVLYYASEGYNEAIGFYHFPTSSSDEFFEAQGGVQATQRNADVYNSLRTRTYELTRDWHSTLQSLYEQSLPLCQIEYSSP